MLEIVPPSATGRERKDDQASSPSRWWLWLFLLVLTVGGGYGGWHYKGLLPLPAAAGKEQKPSPPPSPVAVMPVRKGVVKSYLTALGTVTAANTVTIRSRVDGQLLAVHYQEGQLVSQGSLLAEIDPRPFAVQLTQAEGQELRDQEVLKNARLDLERYRTLWQQDSLPRQQLETQEALVRQYEAAMKVDTGAIESAKLQLSYCRILAPLGGRVGFRLVDPGNMVRASDPTGLVTITQIQPISVLFSIPEDNLPQVSARSKIGPTLTVDAYDRAQKVKLASGVLTTMDNQIDPTTGTVKLKATFANREQELFPNQFVNVKLLLESKPEGVLVPAAAIQRGAQGTFVYLVGEEKSVTVRPVVVGVEQGEDVAILSGLEVGESVVVDGSERLREGTKVEIKEPGKNGKDHKEKEPTISAAKTAS